MPKKGKHERGGGRKPNQEYLDRAQAAIAAIAMREGISKEEVRTQIKLAMLCGLVNNDPQVQAEWKRIPCGNEIPTPEELIAFLADKLSKS